MSLKKLLGRPLNTEDITGAAGQLRVSRAHVQAVLAVEAAGSGFLGQQDEDGILLPKILFEAHIFSRETRGRFDDSHPDLSSPSWNQDLYKGGAAEHGRLQQAADLDFAAAYRSASWGLFQIMGFNHLAAGYAQWQDFAGVQYISEGLQLQCGVNFILSEELDKPLRQEDWHEFARGYNGPGYEENRYHERLAQAFERFFATPPEEDSGVKEVQQALKGAGFNLDVDGIFGPMTEAAIREFQKQNGLQVDGIAGPKTRETLGLE